MMEYFKFIWDCGPAFVAVNSLMWIILTLIYLFPGFFAWFFKL